MGRAMFGGGRGSDAMSAGYRAGYMSSSVRAVRKWLKEDYVNGVGAEEGTLRIEKIEY